ncbi:hypothetical protein PFICI_10598 [Pestalotiopsis fici W106-1]|uniref:Clr5 domain-containing protein n=1 Tax=Pestalotiopsis fici (strain W106-1 / CGMCC3.15140) TaxID=1229662 RepID=W3X063_PESFW|nr:uncharacterized protein PFICI_10598 [Pestalotiopsis fici W106-1]ETS78536.1 hypothetical protein PFICI_10598 [Pestalotiopsis fici W106-1]
MASSSDSHQRKYTARISNQEWEKWKDDIRTEFLGDKTVDEVVASLNNRGLNVTKPQLQHKAKQWRLHKNLSSDTWRYIDHTVRKRKADGKESVVILSGKRLCTKKTTPESPGSEIDLFVSTPRASSPSLAELVVFPRSLPWYQFLQNVSMKLLPAPKVLTTRGRNSRTQEPEDHGNDTISRLARYEQKDLAKFVTPATIQFVLSHLVRRTIQLLTKSEEIAKLQNAFLSVEWMAARFSSILPESFSGQNLQRASSLISNKDHDQQKTLSHIFIYLASNHFVLDEENGLESNLSTAEAFVLLIRLISLGSPRMLHNLIQFSRESLTLAAAVEELFQAAIIVGALDIVANILEKKPWMITVEMRTHIPFIGTLPPLHYAVSQGSVDLINILLKFQPDVNGISRTISGIAGWAPLSLAACHRAHQLSCRIADILLQNGANPYAGASPDPLSMCLGHGNNKLALQLIELGASADNFCRSEFNGIDIVDIYHNGTFFDATICATMSQRGSSLSDFSPFGLAASANDPQRSTHDENELNEVMDDEKEVVVLTLVEALTEMTDSPCGSDAMILAASRGHLSVMSYLRNQLGQEVDSTNGAMSPLYAAVLWNQVDAARQLLEWGACASMDERLLTSWIESKHGLPTPLHIAIQFGSSDMLELLIHHRCDIDQPSEFFTNIYSKQWRPSGWRSIEHKPDKSNREGALTCSAVSPLLFAVLQKQWDKAETLLALGAKPSGDVLFEASQQGRSELVARLLEKGVRPDESIRGGMTALEEAAKQGHEPVVLQLLDAGPTIINISFSALFCLPNTSTIQTLLRNYPITPTSRDERTKRSYLENAILRGHEDIVTLALEFDHDYYDSGALCAAVFQDITNHSPFTHLLLHELVTRRENSSCTKSQVQLSLESTAISMAAFYDRLDIIDTLSQSRIPGRCQVLAVRVDCLQDDSPEYHKTWRSRLAHDELLWYEWHNSQSPGASPLEYAAMGGSERASLRLLQEGCRPDVGSLHAAMSHLGDDVAEKFIEQCENVNMVYPFYHNYTTLQAAVRKRKRKLVEKLLAKGADINMYEPSKPGLFNEWGFPALTIAVSTGDTDLVSLLLKEGADVNTGHSSKAFCTALQLAVAEGYISIVKCLISHDADMSARRYPCFGFDIPGQGTPLEEAARRGRLDILQLLLDSGVSTLRYGRVQYVLSIIYAQKSGHHAILQALNDHRSWSAEDQEIYEELAEFPPDRGLFFHPKEYREAEFSKVVGETIWQLGLHHSLGWWKDEPLVPRAATSEGNFDRVSECFTNESDSDGEESTICVDENFSTVARIADATLDNSEELDRPEGDEVNLLGNETSQYSFDTELSFMEQSSIFHAIDGMDTLHHSLWPCNGDFEWSGDDGMNMFIDPEDILQWPGEDGMNMSVHPENQNSGTTFAGQQQDADEVMEMEGDIFEHIEWYQTHDRWDESFTN